MSAPQIIARALTFDFTQSLSTTTGLPLVLEIAVTPLDDGSSVTSGATFAGGVQTATIELSSTINPVTFDLIPTYSPGLDAPINYRVMWRTGLMSRTYTYDFAMPDADLTWAQLTSTIGNIIDGTSYLQQSDLGVAGGVARLDINGNVVTASGVICATESDITTVDESLTAETVAREQADAALASNFSAQLATQVDATLVTAEGYTDSAVSTLNGDIANERGNRINADTDLQTQITANLTAVDASIAAVAATVPDTETLAAKADLVDGTVPLDELPTSLLSSAITVPNQVAMLALTVPTVHQGDIAVRPDGIFLLNAADPSVLSNWVPLSIITSVNGYRGVVTLAAADVDAIPVGGAIAQSQVTGLNTALSKKANQSDMTAAQAAISAIQSDSTLVHTVSGTIPMALLSTETVYLNTNGQLVNGAGTIIPISGGSGAVFSVNGSTGVVTLTAASVGAIAVGGSVTQSQVTGLSTALNNKADLVSGTVPLAELPSLPMTQITGLSTALSNTAQLTSGLISLSNVPILPTSQITGLSAIISNNALTSTSNAVNRIASIEGQIATLGGGGGGGTTTTTPFYTSSNTTTPVTAGDFTTVTNLHSPWGIDSDGTITGTIGTWYYLYTGVRGTDVAYPYISSNGHLQLHKWNESGPADPVYALQSDLAAANTQISARALETDLLSLTNTVNTKANQSDLNTTNTVVGTLATQANLNALSTTVGTLATQTSLASTNAIVATLATAASVTALTTTVGTKANQSDMTTAQTNITTINTTLGTKADLVSGVLKASEIPTGIPQANISGLTSALAACATLTGTGGTVIPLSQTPQNIPQSYVSGLGTTLGAKADLVNGVIPLSELPQGALPDINVVANQAAMLALTTGQVQYGSIAIITGTSAQGTYVLTGSNPASLGSWTEFSTPQAPVTSVNGDTGTVVLGPTDVGALASNASIPITQITGLSTQLNAIPTTYATQSTVNALPTFSNVQTMFTNSSFTKRADYVANTPLASLSGSQSVDGVLVPTGAVVLAIAQSSSVNNGLWTVSGGVWSRPVDYATGSYIAKDTIVIVNNQSTGSNGTTNNYTIYQETATSGFIDSTLTTWSKIGYVDPPFVPAAGNGITVSGSTFSANVVTGGGVINGSSGLSADPNVVARKFVGAVPSGSTIAGITHNLNTSTPIVSIWQTGSNTLVLAGITVTTSNSISIEFNSAPSSGQYTVCVVG
jgi:hypothetical protein